MIRDFWTLIIFLKYVGDVFCRNPHTAIPDLDADLVVGATTTDQNTPPISVAYRIRNQIADHLFEHVPIATDNNPGSNDP